jgi:murein DD-endopeptidase MepM/ murein hydrolase activator NlpD
MAIISHMKGEILLKAIKTGLGAILLSIILTLALNQKEINATEHKVIIKNKSNVSKNIKPKSIKEVPAMAAKNDGFLFPAAGTISSAFGYRKININGVVTSEVHKGIDIAATMGSKIFAARGGKVSYAGVIEGYGNVIILKHDSGFETLYAHCSKIEVKASEMVNEGNEIGKVGSTGKSTGPHLHFEVRLNGKAVNPLDYLQSTKVTEVIK